MGNGRVFISHAHEDNERCKAILIALDAWGVDYWFDLQSMDVGQELGQQVQQAIRERDVFLRICTPAAQRSYWVRTETGAFRGLQAAEHKSGQADKRVLVNLILDSGYQPEPFDLAAVFIDAVTQPQAAWLRELRLALGLPDLAPRTAPTTQPESAPLPPTSTPTLDAPTTEPTPSRPRRTKPATTPAPAWRRATARTAPVLAVVLLLVAFSGLALAARGNSFLGLLGAAPTPTATPTFTLPPPPKVELPPTATPSPTPPPFISTNYHMQVNLPTSWQVLPHDLGISALDMIADEQNGDPNTIKSVYVHIMRAVDYNSSWFNAGDYTLSQLISPDVANDFLFVGGNFTNLGGPATETINGVTWLRAEYTCGIITPTSPLQHVILWDTMHDGQAFVMYAKSNDSIWSQAWPVAQPVIESVQFTD